MENGNNALPGRSSEHNPHPLISIVVVNFNVGSHLGACVAALQAQTVEAFEAIIVDNGSTDDSLASAIEAVEEDRRFRFDRAVANLGFAAGNNRALATARGDWIATLNPDAVPEPEWLERLLAATRAHPEVSMFGSLQLVAGAPDRLDGAGDRYLAFGIPWRDRSPTRMRAAKAVGADSHRCFSPCAAAALYRRDAIEEVGGFDSDFFCYVEDVDLGFRLRLAGHDCLQVPGARVSHVGGVSSGGEMSEFARYHGTRNLVWCFTKNMPGPLLLPLLPAHLVVLLILLVRSARRGQLRTSARALLDAARGLSAVMRKRRRIQGTRQVSSVAIARALDWNPLSYLNRARS